MNHPKSFTALLLLALLPGARVFSRQDAPICKVAEVTRTGEQVLAVCGNKSFARLGYLDATAATYHAAANGSHALTAVFQISSYDTYHPSWASTPDQEFAVHDQHLC